MRYTLYIIIMMLLGLLLGWTACAPIPHDTVPAEEPLVIYPDYQDITVPCNIAPLNFMIRGDYDAIYCTVRNSSGQEEIILTDRGRGVTFEDIGWKELLRRHLGGILQITVIARRTEGGQWIRYPDFGWHISRDEIDGYVTYRLIEPGYEVWDNVSIEERCVETFDTRYLADGPNLKNRCMNCHTHGGDQGQYSFLYIRGEGGGTILNRDGRLRKVTLRGPKMSGGTVYGGWHPSGPLRRRFRPRHDTPMSPCDQYATRAGALPAFSADGRWTCFCTARNPCGDTIPSAANLRQG